MKNSENLRMLYTDGAGTRLEFTDGSDRHLVFERATLDQVRRDAPGFFKFMKSGNERKAMYRGFVLVSRTNPLGQRPCIIYAWNTLTNDTDWITQCANRRAAKKLIDKLWLGGWTAFEGKGYVTERI